MTRLDEATWELLEDALDLYHGDRGATQRLHHHLSRFEEPLRIAIVGPSKSGKSTLVNAILGEEIAPVEVVESQDAFTWYKDGPSPQVTAFAADGSARELAVARSASGIRIDSGGWKPERVNDIVVTWPTRALRHASLVDTPGAEEAFLRDADAVLYLTPDVRGTHLRVLQTAQEGSVAKGAPVNVILVLSRADEIGGGRIDALLSARQLARQHYRDPQVNAVCMGVVAVGGLIALASRVLTEQDFGALTAMATMPRTELEPYLLSTDRFVGADFPALVDIGVRSALLDRFGIHGVRLTTALIRTGCDTRAKLAAEMVRRSGLTELRESISHYFIERREVLKSRAALVAVESMLHAEPRPGSEELLAQVERIMTTTHGFRELRLLATLRAPGVGFDSDLLAEAHRLVGGNGTNLAARLGVDHEVRYAEMRALTTEALYRWQNRAEDQRLSLRQRRVASVVVRSCEGVLARLTTGSRRSRL